MSNERLPFDEAFLKEKLRSDPTTWETRRQLAHGLYDKQAYAEAAEIIWTTDQIPSTDLDLAFAIRILAKAQPRRAIRLLTAVLELNQGKAVQNMAMANALLHHGMVLQAARFYGAALEADPTLVNPDLEHFILWSDDESTMWGLFEKNRPKLGELPWMLRDPREALRLTSRISLHTTPISVPELPIVEGESIKHDLYQQEATFNSKITPPPAVTIPIDRVNPKDRLYDPAFGANVVASPAAPAAESDQKTPVQEVPPASIPAVVPIAPPARLHVPGPPKAAAQSPAAIPVSEVVQPQTAPTGEEPKAPEVAASTPAPVQAFPAKVLFPDSSKPTASVAASESAPTPQPAAAEPEAPARPTVLPFFADLAKPAVKPAEPSPKPVENPPEAAAPFFADPVSADEPAAAQPEATSEEKEPEDQAAPTNEKETPEPDPFKISQSSVPTQLLKVKWSTSPARPGGAGPKPAVTAAPVAPPVPPPTAPLAVAAAPAAAPVAASQPSSPEEVPASQVAPAPAPSPFTPTGPPTRPLVPMGAPAGPPTGVLLTGSPTRSTTPTGSPAPATTEAEPPRRRLLFFPGRKDK